MTLEADFYRVRIRFGRLFADPRIFDTPPTFARSYLQTKGLAVGKLSEIYETTEDINPLDDAGRPSTPSGTGKFRYEDKVLRSEYMEGATIELEYSDFGSGLSPEEHKKSWMMGRWDDLSFQMKGWHHQHVNTGVASVQELYRILKARANPTTMATIELPIAAGSVLKATVQYLADEIGRLSRLEGGMVEVYAAKLLDSQERKSLDARLGRESTASTLYVILSTSPGAGRADAPQP